MNKNQERTNKGFTLIELLVVIAVIAILALLIVPNLMAVRQRARDTSAKNGVQQLKKALRIYYNDNQSYPATSDVPSAGVPFIDSGTTYIQEVPTYSYYGVSSDGERFVLYIPLENLSDSDIAASHTRCDGVNGSVGSVTGAPSLTDTTYVVCED